MAKFTVYVSIVVESEDEQEADVLIQSTLENALTLGSDIESFTIDQIE
jgi:tetrahydromethanopterin S-methyltransferase subunit H